MMEPKEEKKYIKTWSHDCRHSVGSTGEVSYLCEPKNLNSDHWVVHETMPPYLTGDYKNLS